MLIVSGVFVLNGGWDKLLNPPTVRAFGDLFVDFHVDVNTPIFNMTNMKPGDYKSMPIDVTNNGTVARYVAVKGERTNGFGITPFIESVLSIVIKDGANPIYGPKTLNDFFTQSATPNGIMLNIINPGGNKTYNFQVTFPSSAGDEFQAKSVIFNIIFGTSTANHLVINEVYYNADEKHGLNEKNDKSLKKYTKNQWVEIYNPTNQSVSLKNWSLTDNTGTSVVINANKTIAAGGFALISKDASGWINWNENKSAMKIELGKIIGDGLDIGGDRLILKNTQSIEVDQMGWNSSVPIGSSTERLAPGFDTDADSDWKQTTPPTPGN